MKTCYSLLSLCSFTLLAECYTFLIVIHLNVRGFQLKAKWNGVIFIPCGGSHSIIHYLYVSPISVLPFSFKPICIKCIFVLLKKKHIGWLWLHLLILIQSKIRSLQCSIYVLLVLLLFLGFEFHMIYEIPVRQWHVIFWINGGENALFRSHILGLFLF